MGKRNLYCDIETTGLKIEDGAVPLSIGFLLDNGVEDPGPHASLVVTILPTELQWAKANDRALEVNGFTWEKLLVDGVSIEKAKETICAWLAENDVNEDTVRYVGQNPGFDLKFLKHFIPELQWMGFPLEQPTDVIELAKELTHRDQNFRVIDFKGHNIALALGVQPEPSLHTALGGIQAVRRNYVALAKRLNLN